MQAHPAGPRHAQIAPESRLSDPATDPLDFAVWPQNAQRNSDGGLAIAGADIRQLAQEHGTPLFVFDEQDVRSRAREFAQAYTDAQGSSAGRVYYAAKAFLSVAVARWVTEEGLGIDVASGGELEIAIRAGVPGELLLMHGNNKSRAEIHRAVEYGVSRIVIDSFEEIARIASIASELGVIQPVLIRATVGVEAHTHEYIATAHEDQKFGLSAAAGEVEEAARRIAKLPSLHLLGLHSHIGSQIFDSSGFEVAASRIVALAHTVHMEQGIEIAELNLGGGMGIAYLPDDDPLSVQHMAQQICGIVVKACADIGLPAPALSFEPGRAIIGPGGITVYEVGTVKPISTDRGVRTYISVDGGMSDNIRTALYGAEYTVALVSRLSKAEPILCRVVGKHCESGDIVVRDCWLPGDITPGDLIAVAATGAYCRSMASNYNQLPRPEVISVADSLSTTILRRETMNDLLALDPFA
ncbi:MAG: diaminopimelate decarboxylase [Candidatus Nanopelagicales bacterium]|nr:diaminopimelate decarboxylase [Candidatus Nanopelagicales bacterium]